MILDIKHFVNKNIYQYKIFYTNHSIFQARLFNITNPTMTKGIIDNFSICEKPVSAKFFSSYVKELSTSLMHSIIGLHFYVGAYTLQSLSLKSFKHMIDFLSFSFSAPSITLVVCQNMLKAEKQMIVKISMSPILKPSDERTKLYCRRGI